MCRSNTCKKSHFVRKIYSATNKWYGRGVFSARSAIFCCHWGSTFSCRNNQAIGPRLSAFSPLFLSFVISRFCFRSIEMDAAKIQHFLETTKLSRLFLQYWMKKASRHFSVGLARILGNYFLQCEKIITFHNISKYLIEIITFCYFILEVEQKSTIFAAFIYFVL